MKPWVRYIIPIAAVLIVVGVVHVIAQRGINATTQEIAQNPTRYDKQVVSVIGTVSNYREHLSRRGNPYTTFRLTDEGHGVSVFAWRHQGLTNGQRVRVTGRFEKRRVVGRAVFHNEIEASKVVPQ